MLLALFFQDQRLWINSHASRRVRTRFTTLLMLFINTWWGEGGERRRKREGRRERGGEGDMQTEYVTN